MSTDPTNRPTEESAQPKKAGLRKGLRLTWLSPVSPGLLCESSIVSPEGVSEDVDALRWLQSTVLKSAHRRVVVVAGSVESACRYYAIQGAGSDFSAESVQP